MSKMVWELNKKSAKKVSGEIKSYTTSHTFPTRVDVCEVVSTNIISLLSLNWNKQGTHVNADFYDETGRFLGRSGTARFGQEEMYDILVGRYVKKVSLNFTGSCDEANIVYEWKEVEDVPAEQKMGVN